MGLSTNPWLAGRKKLKIISDSDSSPLLQFSKAKLTGIIEAHYGLVNIKGALLNVTSKSQLK
jgi:hypothetical protein